MTTYYVDHGGSSTAPYDTQAKAATTLATILAIPVAAGDIIYCCDNAGAGEVIAAELNCASGGTNAGGWIKIIGCNSSGVVDGTRYYIDGNGAGINIFDFVGQDMWWLENIEVGNTGVGVYSGFYGSTGTAIGITMINCSAHNCGGAGFNLGVITGNFIRCVAYSNTTHGFAGPASNFNNFLFCCSRDNTADGFNGCQYSVFYGCIAHGNTDDGWGSFRETSTAINCISDGNTDDGIEIAASTSLFAGLIIGCRITNQSGAGDNGLITFDEPCIVGWSYFEDNDDNIAGASHDAVPAVTFQFIPIENGSTTTNLENLANTNEGYVTLGSNYATNYVDAGDPDLRRVAITIPWS